MLNRNPTVQPRHVPETGIQVDNRFGTLFVDTIRPERLLVPTAKDLVNLVAAAPGLGSIDVDHYKC